MAVDPSRYPAWFVPDRIGEWNWERWNSPEYGELHNKALSEPDAAKRHDMYVCIQDLMDDAGACVFLTRGVNAWLHRDQFKFVTLPDACQSVYRRCSLA